MIFFTKLLVFALTLIVGLLILKYLDKIVYTLGKSEWAETKIGTGGTYTMWRLFALFIIIGGFLFALFI